MGISQDEARVQVLGFRVQALGLGGKLWTLGICRGCTRAWCFSMTFVFTGGRRSKGFRVWDPESRESRIDSKHLGLGL